MDSAQASSIMEASIVLAKEYLHSGEPDKALEVLQFANDDEVIDALYDAYAEEQERLERLGYLDE